MQLELRPVWLPTLSISFLNNGYQCDAELIAGDSVPNGRSRWLKKGARPDVAPSFGQRYKKKRWIKAVAWKTPRLRWKILDWCGWRRLLGPAYLVKKNIQKATIEGVIKARPIIVHTFESDTKHAFYGCPQGWDMARLRQRASFLNALKTRRKLVLNWIDPGFWCGAAGTIS